jgi:hypothetical protein
MELSLLTIVITIVVVFIAGSIVGWLTHARGVLLNMLEDPDHMIKLLTDYKNNPDRESTDENAHEITVEQDNGMFYLYEKSNKQFLGQGTTLEIALEEVAKRFPDGAFQGIISEEDAKKMGLV